MPVNAVTIAALRAAEEKLNELVEDLGVLIDDAENDAGIQALKTEMSEMATNAKRWAATLVALAAKL